MKKGQIIFNKHEVLDFIGEGGQGITAVGLNHDTGKRVLVKALKYESLSNPIALERFQREGAVRINNPYIVSPIEADSNYIIFPYIDALNIVDLMQTGEWLPKPKDILTILIKSCLGLQCLHDHNIIHRDIKPGNILYSPENDVVVLIDLGIAQFIDDPRITQSCHNIATPLYASPEQLTNPLSVDPRSDIFSLGVTAYEIATGMPAFAASTVDEIASKVLYENPDPIKVITPQLPEFIADAIEKMMAKNPDDRFQSTSEVIDFLSDTDIYHCLACGKKSGFRSCSICGRNYIAEKLLIVTPDNRRRTYSIPMGDFFVGRKQLANYEYVSSDHCRFSVDNSGIIKISDNQSTNKTYVNRKFAGQPIHITHNDIIEISNLTAFILSA